MIYFLISVHPSINNIDVSLECNDCLTDPDTAPGTHPITTTV
jgi:hypothetical protein